MPHSQQLFELAQRFIPGGVNSPVRAYNSVGGTPPFIQRAQGAYIYDEDGNEYVDYVGSWGPMILGHADSRVIQAVKEACENGLSYGAPTQIEVALAQKVCELMPNIEMVRMVSSGTEATLSAIRLARGFTGRNKILKFEGCYHGHNDSLLVKAGSGSLTFGQPDSAGVPKEIAQFTLTARYNDIDQVKEIFSAVGNDIAAIIVEPVAGNMNCIPPQPGFLQSLREICDQYQSLLIFDEVMTGFRVALGGAQALYNIKPDLTTLAKIIGGGMPVGAFGGRKNIMQKIAPCGPVYQAGTLSGNPITMTAGLTTLNLISKPGFYVPLEKFTNHLLLGLKELANHYQIPLHTQHVGSMFGLFFTAENRVDNCDDAKKCNIELFKKFFHGMLREKIYLAPSAFEAGFVSACHGDKELTLTLAAAEKVFKELQDKWPLSN